MDAFGGLRRDLRDGGALRRIGAALAKIHAGLAWSLVHREDMHRLAMMSDRELRDIGLLRQDVRDAALLGADAFDFLHRRRDEQRGRLSTLDGCPAPRRKTR